MSSRNSRNEPLEVKHVPTNATSTPAISPPVENTGPPASPAPSVNSFDRPILHSHNGAKVAAASAQELANVLPRSNRFSLSFPIQTSRNTSPVRKSQSPVREAPSVVPESLALLTGPTDTNFLTAIAAQERRVLELKEELNKAEAELNELKKQWTQHEAQRKREDARRSTKLQPVQTSLPSTNAEDDVDGSNAWMQHEMQRRKALLNGNSSNNRTVFSGSRHMRTLSLLSPAKKDSATPSVVQKPPARPQRKDSNSEHTREKSYSEAHSARSLDLPRAATLPDMTVDGAKTRAGTDEVGELVDNEILFKTGKKVATDLRDGLWTFWEDLRQATVGDEATETTSPPRMQSSASNLRRSKTQSSKDSRHRPSWDALLSNAASIDAKRPTPNHTTSSALSLASAPALADPSFWTENGVCLSQQATPVKTKKVSPAVRHAKSVSKVSSTASSDNEAWDTWDSPQSQGSRTSSIPSDTNTVPSSASNLTSPRTSSELTKTEDWTPRPRKSPSDNTKKDPLPWPALATFGPKALKRTASHLMAEWEKSLTPSPTKEDSGQHDYLGLGAEAAAASVPTERRSNAGFSAV